MNLTKIVRYGLIVMASAITLSATAGVKFYDNEDLRGNAAPEIRLEPGQTKKFDMHKLRNMEIPNDKISSIRVSDGYEIKVFQHWKFGGQSRVYDENQYSLGRFNNLISSVIIKRIEEDYDDWSDGWGDDSGNDWGNSAGVKFYNGEDLRRKMGPEITLKPGQTKKFGGYELQRMGILNDKISSIRVSDGYEIKVFQHGDWRGQSRIYDENQYSLGKFNNLISSIIIKRIEQDYDDWSDGWGDDCDSWDCDYDNDWIIIGRK